MLPCVTCGQPTRFLYCAPCFATASLPPPEETPASDTEPDPLAAMFADVSLRGPVLAVLVFAGCCGFLAWLVWRG